VSDRIVPLPEGYRNTVNGPQPEFDYLALVLHDDGSVTRIDTRDDSARTKEGL